MAREWYSTCKDCGDEYGYSDSSHQLSIRRGMSRPERCPKCRKTHSREIATLGLSHFELTPIKPIPPGGLRPGRLGGLIREERKLKVREKVSKVNFAEKFGIQDENIREYFNLMSNHQVTVVVAPTGAGKSTFLPYRLLVPPTPFPADLWTKKGQILITQPRIQATRGISRYVAEDLHASSLGAGFDVGFRHSGAPATDWRNKLVYMTDGSLINMIVRNELGRVSVIMIDEAHERSVNIDLILGLLKSQLPRYPHLKLIIASATIKASMFLRYYGAPADIDPDSDEFKIATDQGFDLYDNKALAQRLQGCSVGFYGFPGKRKYPVEARFRDQDPIPIQKFSGRMPEEVAKKAYDILIAMETGQNNDLITMTIPYAPEGPIKGNILAFLQGQKPIEQAVTRLRELINEDSRLAGKVNVLPLYTKLPQDEQTEALKPKGENDPWKVVISTNVAETSLTVDGIVHVIETGLLNESQWDPKTQTTFVVPKQHSQAGCQQRWGRAGRVQEGIAHCLYTEEQFSDFPEHTDPEIVRAPIDQIILTAKAAGVNNIMDFDWIQEPSPEELARAPCYLQQVGALDEDGDLTEHGLELRSFAEEIDVANLMILADRYGCAVEMATVIPMLKLGGYTKLLTWEKNWDAATKYAVHKIHQGLIAPCLDDLEFYLKLWAAWEGHIFGRNSDEQRSRWSGLFFVNHALLKKEVSEKRKSLLDSLSGHTKYDFIRPIDFDLLTRLRIVMMIGLSNQIYRLDNETTSSDGSPIFKPHITSPDKYPELVALHEDATVEISPESICFGRQNPDFFVCGQRRRYRLRESPFLEPQSRIAASFIVLIRPEWLVAIEQHPITVARILANETRTSEGILLQTSHYSRLFLDQHYPIGAQYQFRMLDQGTIELVAFEAEPQYPKPGRSDEDIEPSQEAEVLDFESELKPEAGFLTKNTKSGVISVVSEEEDEIAIWSYLLEEDEFGRPSPTRVSLSDNKYKPLCQIIYSKEQIASKALFSGVIDQIDFSDRENPCLNLTVPVKPDPFEQFSRLYSPGEDIDVDIISIERYIGDWLHYLIVRERVTGLQIILDPFDISISGRNYAVDYLRPLIGREPIRVTVEEILPELQRVRVSRLRFSEEARLQLMGQQSERVVNGAIVEVREDRVYVCLDPQKISNYMPCIVSVHIDRIPNRPEEMSFGQGCQVKVRKRDWKKPLQRPLPSLSDELVKKVTYERVGDNIRWDEGEKKLIAEGRMSHWQRQNLLGLSDDNDYRYAINWLFRRSNDFLTDIIDITGIKYLTHYYESNEEVSVTIVSLNDHGATLRTSDGGEFWIYGSDLTYESDNIQEFYQVGQTINLSVTALDEEKGVVKLSGLKPEDYPGRKYSVGQKLFGTVQGFREDGDVAFVKLRSGLNGRLPKDEIGFEPIANARDKLA